MSATDAALRMLAKYGQAMTLKREGESDLPVKGKRIPGALVDAGNSGTQQQFRVKIAPTELLASAWTVKVPSANGDSLRVDGRDRAVLDVIPLREGETVALYELLVAG
ncbi:hypothetical protein [uncultured Reyranella sp.]|jgi:hypothetical protein|uniref:hypothetical protein n=1 Tax=uncultured Reyranella sp. TaxID=735512 RepID=UPI00259CC161|nr:hypothetical protein [uncultured Reyranella sp.]